MRVIKETTCALLFWGGEKKFIVKIREIPKIKISDLEIRENQIPIPLEITKYQIHLGKQDYYNQLPT